MNIQDEMWNNISDEQKKNMIYCCSDESLKPIVFSYFGEHNILAYDR